MSLAGDRNAEKVATYLLCGELVRWRYVPRHKKGQIPRLPARRAEERRNLMPFVSYAQNYEDVLLWRALRHVEDGFYVDVGAADPIEHSVTRAFYERGWTGVNIEPVTSYFERLVADRPRDLNLLVLAGAQPGLGTIHVISGTGLSTMDAEFASRHAEKGRSSTPETLPIVPLRGILSTHGDRPIHFLKIDVEGAERAVLEGVDFELTRPWIVVVEATEPETQIRTDHLWADLLLTKGYSFVVFDGLNCFYVAEEHANLKEVLALPPNDFDNFRRYADHLVLEQLERANIELTRLSAIERSYEAMHAGLPKMQDLQADRDRLARHVAALEANRADTAEEHEKITLELDRCRSELEKTAAEAANLSASLADAQTGRALTARQIAQLRATLVQVRHDFAGQNTALNEAREEAAALSVSLAKTTVERFRMREQIGLLNRHVNLLDGRIYSLEILVEDWRARFRQIFESKSWRLTSPIRRAGLLTLRLRGVSTGDAEAHFVTIPAMPALPRAPVLPPAPEAPAPQPVESSHRLLVAPDKAIAEADLRGAALPASAGAILARLEALAHSDPSVT